MTDDMKTHKNPELRASSVVKASEAKAAPVKKFGAPSAPVVKPPVCELQGKKWIVVSGTPVSPALLAVALAGQGDAREPAPVSPALHCWHWQGYSRELAPVSPVLHCWHSHS